MLYRKPLIILLLCISPFCLTQAAESKRPAGVLPETLVLAPFELLNQDKQEFTEHSFSGDWHILFVGYTHCPDICPTTLGLLNGMSEKLKDTHWAHPNRYVLLSVDPKRDTPDHLKDYMAYFNADFQALTGAREQIDKLTSQLGARYIFEGDTTGTDYLVHHSANIYIIDPQGRFYAKINPPFSVDKLTAEFTAITAYYYQTQEHHD